MIWSGSLFTHFDESAWVDALGHLRNAVAPDGVLVLTTHGAYAAAVAANDPLALSQCPQLVGGYGLKPAAAAAMVSDYQETGFGYARYPLGGTFGVSLSTDDWARERVAAAGFTLVEYLPRGWAAHQDVIMCTAK
ncbi:MAG: hypothetical protein M3N95_14310 [Actinomycetota bacterium]|nr:hypothetical protein [Actinomycetota bacterium]